MVNKFAKYLEAFLSLFSISEGCLICMLEINGGNSHNYEGLEVEDLYYNEYNCPVKMRTVWRITLKKVASLSAPK
ncbi:unnamed protein product [Trifolium pratense]|uniref:Uncharacterized protein n=1 Tax=Trifolium pratense TaxID=57577 RepID=A0ACB0K6D8_TRIPR|nr:unnamed protein product [Trifolium pratense]